MKKYSFWIVVILLTVGVIGYAVHKKPAAPQRLGVEHPDQGQQHIDVGQQHEAYNSDPPSSGPHYSNQLAPTTWGVHTEELADEILVHNEEHGGILVTYRPDLPADQIKKLQELFAAPYSRKDFHPLKVVVIPRSKNTKPIELASWTRTLSLDNYDENALVQFYLTNVNKAPESNAQ
ncbi:MAG TPA: DUF3105 domain-containing protein [Candidatus Limnocylindrales bacterium]|nr:DUF3105 domain-containing protein [Candidatus Limnocylindrales bacterium]